MKLILFTGMSVPTTRLHNELANSALLVLTFVQFLHTL